MAKWFALLFVPIVVCSLAVAVGFPWKQAVLLAIFAAYVERGLGMAAAKPTHTFEPYWVWIIPNWDQILTDYTTVKSEEDWQKIKAWCGRASNAFPLAWFSVLRHDKDGALIYRGSELGFSTAVDWRYKVKSGDRFQQSEEGPGPEEFHRMDFFVKQSFDVIQLGISVEMDWWQTFSPNCPVPLETNDEHIFGLVKIVLAQLPIREFDLYWNEVDYEPKHINKIWDSVRESRKKHGWEEKEKEKYMDFPSHWQPIKIKSKYFEVEHHILR